MPYGYNTPDFTSQDAATYKANIDTSVDKLAQVASTFYCHPLEVPNMQVLVEGGYNSDGDQIGPWTVSGIGAPSSNPRVDIIYLDLNTGAINRATGSESATPADPYVPTGMIKVARLHMEVGMTAIDDAVIEDTRVIVGGNYIFVSGGYTYIVDPDGLYRVLIGRGGIDNRFIFKLHTSDAGSSMEIQNSGGTAVAKIDGTGNMFIKGTLQENWV